MKFTLIVNTGPYQHQASDSACRFARAALEQGHRIVQVFFYHDGVYHGGGPAEPPQDDRNVTQNWVVLAAEYQLDLVVCTTGAARRGVALGEQGPQQTPVPLAGFRAAGLGQLAVAVAACDRLVTFGD